MSWKISTVPYKGSKKSLLFEIENFCKETNSKTFFDGFSGTGIVSAYFRSKGYVVDANDISISSALYGRVFLNGFDQKEVDFHIDKINNLKNKEGWITKNYSGERVRKVRGKKEKENRPLAFKEKNSVKIDAARDYVEEIEISNKSKDALIFSIILAMNSVMNISNDQKSSLKFWSSNSEKDICFKSPSNICGPLGNQYLGDVFSINKSYDFVYLDPPYCSGVLYPACYHLNDSVVIWDKPNLNQDYALPRPERAIFNNKKGLDFFSKKTANFIFDKLIKNFSNSKKILLSYSDAPRNSISLEAINKICCKYGKTEVVSKKHKLCAQPNSLQKISDSVNEYFFVINPGEN